MLKNNFSRIEILGAGPAGLGVGYYAKKKGIPLSIFELTNEVGGNSRTITKGAFRYDTGAHRLHNKHHNVTQMVKTLLGDDLKKILELKLQTNSTSEWCKIFEENKIPCGPIFNIKEAVENPQVDSRNMIVKAYHKVVGDFKLAGNPIKMSSYKDEKTRGDIPDLDEHREKILKEFS